MMEPRHNLHLKRGGFLEGGANSMKGAQSYGEVVFFFESQDALQADTHFFEDILKSHTCSAPDANGVVVCQDTTEFLPNIRFLRKDVKVAYSDEKELHQSKKLLEDFFQSHVCGEMGAGGSVLCNSKYQNFPNIIFERKSSEQSV
jgi:hypothetical protein